MKGNFKGSYLNFLCLGVESGFPTFLSMNLRDKYHTGDATIPAIFLIEYASEKAFFNKFESMKPYFQSAKPADIHPAVTHYPWEEPTTQVNELVWVVTDSSMIEVNGKIFDLSKDTINLEGIIEVFKGWTQMLHLESLKSASKTKDRAIAALKMMDEIFA